MKKMEGVHLHVLLLLVTLIQGIQGQAITPSSVDVAAGDDVSLECRTTTTSDPFLFTWSHTGITSTEAVVVYTGGIKNPASGTYDNFGLDEDKTAKRSTLIINNILFQDAGQYRCTASGQDTIPRATVTVEVGSKPEEPEPEPIALTSNDDNSNPTYQATFDAIGSSPEENITWILDGVTQTDGIVEIDPDISTDPLLFDKRSVFTFPATPENYNVTLECDISGHQVAKLNRNETRLVDIHKLPQPNGIKIKFTISGGELTVSCDVNDAVDAAKPAMSTFFIYSNGTLVSSDNSFTDTEPEQATEFRCEGSNYLGSTNTTETFYPGSTTTPPPVTEHTTEGNTATMPETQGLPAGAIAGIAIGCIFCIVIIVVIVLYFLRPECCPCFAGSGFSIQALFSSCKCSLPTPPPSNKPSGRAVGSSNGSGSEKEKLPQAAPRGHGSIQHTNDNPDQAMYAMVDKKPARGGGGGAGDAPDRGSGPGQNEPPGMLYADLDLSHKAGHTDKHVPKNENDVVVYSSILV